MLLVIIPLLNLLLIFFSRYLGKRISIIISITTVITSFLDSLYKAKEIIINEKILLITFNWGEFLNLDLKFSFLLDSLAIIMSLLITGISMLVMIYSCGYLKEDPHIIRFISFLGFFCGSMLLLVTAGNYLQLFIGWETVGLASFLLISFWTQKNSANQGGLKAIIVNRTGDIFFLLALGIMYYNIKSFDFSLVTLLFFELNEPLIFNISSGHCLAFCLLIAACAKSAQILFHTWLVDAWRDQLPCFITS